MRMTYMLTLVAAPLAFAVSMTSTAAHAQTGEPFIKAEYWKKNISFQDFQAKTRSYFRSERTFDLLVDYVSDEIDQPLSGAQFIALMRSDQVRVRQCPTSERITTGFIRGNEFDWETRLCRPEEEIVQYRKGDRWIDLFSLNCLNAVEDKTPVPPPTPINVSFTPLPPTQERPQTIIWQTPGITIGGTVMSFGCVCCGTLSVMGTPGINVPGQVNQTTTFGFQN